MTEREYMLRIAHHQGRNRAAEKGEAGGQRREPIFRAF